MTDAARPRRFIAARAGSYPAPAKAHARVAPGPVEPRPEAPPEATAASAVEPARPQRLPELPYGVQLVGLGSADLQNLLGQPTLVRSEQGAQYWRYSVGGCQLDLFLYTDRHAGPARVVYFDVRPSGYVTVAHADACSSAAKALRGAATARADGPLDTGELPEVESN